MNSKIARKSSSDPVQEHLREHKSQWNQETSELIQKLIAFKRGLNGKGDLRQGLPSSSIKEPFPSEISSYLSQLTDSSHHLMQDAQEIIREQLEYSEHRTKPRLAKIKNFELEKTASNPFSRLWARVWLRKKLDKNIRIHRVRILMEGASFLRLLRETRTAFLEQDKDSIPNAISLLTRFAEHYAKVFLPVAQSLIFETKKSISSKENIKVTEKKLSEIELISQEIPFAHQVVDFLQKSEQFAEDNKKNIQILFDKLSTTLALINSTNNNVDSSIDLEKLSQELQNYYQELLSLCSSQFQEPKKSFKDYAQQIKTSTAAKFEVYKNYLEQQKQLQKHAEDFVAQWFKKNLLSIIPTAQQRLILDIVAVIDNILDTLDETMDLVEEPNSSIEKIILLIKKNNYLVLNLVDKVSTMSNIYHMMIRRKEKSKNNYLFEISERDLYILKRVQRMILEKIKEFDEN